MECIIVFEEHQSLGIARSSWKFTPGLLMKPKYVGGNTHVKYISLAKKGTRATLIRISNRGNVTVKEVIINSDCFLDFLGEVHPLPDKYKKYLEYLEENETIPFRVE